MTIKTRASKLAQELEQRRRELATKGTVPSAHDVKRADAAGMDELKNAPCSVGNAARC
jgi:hypothetical protein